LTLADAVVRPTLVLLMACGCRGGEKAPPVATTQADSVDATVGMVRRHFVDTTRRSWATEEPRPLNTIIWYPATSGTRADTVWIGPPQRHQFMAGIAAADAAMRPSPARAPLIVLSHGTGGAALQLMWLGQHLAARGYIVAAVNHHGNTAAEPEYRPEAFILWWERAGDLSRVIDAMLADSVFGPRIDRNRIGAAGFSLGGYTVIELAGGRTDLAAYAASCREHHQATLCDGPPEFPALAKAAAALQHDRRVQESMAHAGDAYLDPRVKAVYAIAPALGLAFTPDGLAGVSTPVSIAVGALDSIAPGPDNAARFAARIGGAELFIIPGAGHYTFLAECAAAGAEDLPPLCHDPPGTDRGRSHRAVADSAAAFFGRHF
jgi:predicted dienelactone hydrolase